ncbi:MULTISPECIES: hypothetical protein [Bacteroides]|jgi:nitrate reductase gamma subunit|uniref:hypothetical protein n=1 Tax=Bacteroides TaxID=816 RepID=UPI00189CA759|nr:hypothetical protein [Bacteroides nordii]MBD9110962.1 hypothetical protein [Bacteroides nordii]MCE8466968.1 hypothetical protein [Bacteroides nordii]UYU47963.1 hypothetical protein KQP55_14920 [Bacteroides nordii]
MGLNDWLAIVGAIGGSSTITWLITFWVNRRTNARKENASADGLEMQNLLIVINTLKDEIARVMSEKIKRDEKVDYLYIELRKSEEKALKVTSEKHELEMCLKEAEMKKCNVHGCTDRVPPSDY